ncbi:MAG: hypothetical protein VKJ05_01490 [Synechococcaceae cyanobacterium]|nr:hypothetical protein [Synechococcaceae cyanobacterium]
MALGVATSAIRALPVCALTFTVNKTVYKASTFTGSYNDNASSFSTALMPWWNSSALAQVFTEAIYGPTSALVNPFVTGHPPSGLPNQVSISGHSGYQYAAPLLAWRVDSSAITWNTVYAAGYPTNNTLSLAMAGTESDLSYPLTWITAEIAVAPAPLPLLGAAAAFGWSRNMRRRARA